MLRLLRYCFAIGLLLFTVACEKPFIIDQPSTDGEYNQLVSEAKSFLDTELNAKKGAKAGGIAYDSFLPKEWRDNKLPQWAQAVTFKSEGKDVVEVPLLYNGVDPVYTIKSSDPNSKTNISQRNGVTKALFFKHKDGIIRAYIMKLILAPDYLSKNKGNGKYKKLSFNKIAGEFSGTLILYSWDERLLDLYRYDKGKLVSRTLPTNANKNGRLRQCYYSPNCRNECVGGYNSCCTPEEEGLNPTGYCCGQGYIHCNYVCTYDEVCYPDDNPAEPGGDGGNNNGNDPNNNLDSNGDGKITKLESFADIEINLTDLCYKETADYLFGNNGGAETTGEEIGQMIINLVSEKSRIKIFIEQGTDSNRKLDGWYKAGNLNGTVYLNSEALGLASKEYIAVTLMHELVHGYYQERTRNTLDENAQHKDMAGAYVLPMARAIVGLYGISDEDATALAWGGLYETPDFKALSPVEQTKIKLKNESYKNGDKGTKCNR